MVMMSTLASPLLRSITKSTTAIEPDRAAKSIEHASFGSPWVRSGPALDDMSPSPESPLQSEFEPAALANTAPLTLLPLLLLRPPPPRLLSICGRDDRLGPPFFILRSG